MDWDRSRAVPDTIGARVRGSVRYGRTMMPASAGGNRVPVVTRLAQGDEDTVRDAIDRFNEIGLACLGP